MARNTAGHALRHGRACAATLPGVRCDMARLGLRHGQARPVTQRSASAGWAKGVHLVHPTQFLLSALF